MTIRENIQFFHPVGAEKYMNVLKEKHGAQDHPSQPDSCLMEGEQPFYKPQQFEDHLSILGFNYIPLSEQLILALIKHPELAPDDTFVRWTQEQDLILEATLGKLRQSDLGEIAK